MGTKYPHLCSPITIGNTQFKNRMFSAPVGGTDIANDGCIGARSMAFYELRSKGGAGAITVSECMVHPETDASHAYHLNAGILNSMAAATYTADAIRRHGAIPSLELSHSGMYAGTYMSDKNKKRSMTRWGPVDQVRPDGAVVKALSKNMLHEIIDAYANVAALAKRVGFEMLLIHGGHGWLLNQFFSPYFNKRTDEYGGSLENRCRLAIEVLRAVRDSVGSGFPIEFRMSGSELFEGGYDVSEGVQIARQIEPYINLLHVSAGTYQRGFGDTHPSMFKEHGCNVYLAAEIKKHVSVPVATIGGLNDPQQMEAILASGQADVVEMARALLADPYLPRKITEDRDESIVKCLRCFTCMSERRVTTTRRCAVNPWIGREMEGVDISRVAKPKKVVVIGGGPAGLKAAHTAALRGHDVVLFEKENELGGILRGEQAIVFKREAYDFAQTLAAFCQEVGVCIRLNTLATKERVSAEKPDAIIIAAGSEPRVPPIPGIDSDHVIIVNRYAWDKDRLGKTVVVLGGGLAGCEAAIQMAQDGKQVALVEMCDQLAAEANACHRPLLLERVNALVAVYTGLKAVRVSSEGLFCVDRNGREVLVKGESVVCAAGQKSRRAIVEELRTMAPYCVAIGDCDHVSTITNAIYQGYHAALDI